MAGFSHTRLRGRHVAQSWANQDVPSSVRENGCPDGQMTQVNSIIINSSSYAQEFREKECFFCMD